MALPAPSAMCERTGNCLGFLAIGSNVNVRGANVFNQFLGADKAVVEDDMGGNAQFHCQGLQRFPILLTFTPQNVRMCCSRDDIDQIRMAHQDSGSARITFSMPLFGDSKPNVNKTDWPSACELVLEVVRIHERKVRDSMRNDINLVPRNVVDLAQKTAACSLITISLSESSAVSCNTDRWFGSGSRSTVCSVVTSGIFSFRKRLRMWLPARSSKDAVFKLQAYQVVSIEVQKVCGPFIGCLVFLIQFQPYRSGYW